MSSVNEARRNVQMESVDALQDCDFYGCCLLPTGTGKAWVQIECLRRINPQGRIWYLCDSEDNRDHTFRNELIKWGAEEWIDRIEFMCYQSAYKLENQNVELCLCDEFDMACTPEYIKSIKNNNFKHLILISATLEGKKRGIVKEIAPIVYERSIKEIEEAKILNASRYFLVNFMLSPAENEKYLDYNYQFSKLLNGDGGHNRKRLEMLQIQRKQFLSSLTTAKNVCRKLIKQLYADERNKILVFCGMTDQADAICKYSYHSKSKENHMKSFDEGLIRVVTVVSKADRGLNIKGVNNIIHESPTKSYTKNVQRSGRGRRLDVDDVLDQYYLVPYYKDNRGRISPTVVKRWIYEANAKMNFNPETFKFND